MYFVAQGHRVNWSCKTRDKKTAQEVALAEHTKVSRERLLNPAIRSLPQCPWVRPMRYTHLVPGAL